MNYYVYMCMDDVVFVSWAYVYMYIVTRPRDCSAKLNVYMSSFVFGKYISVHMRVRYLVFVRSGDIGIYVTMHFCNQLARRSAFIFSLMTCYSLSSLH